MVETRGLRASQRNDKTLASEIAPFDTSAMTTKEVLIDIANRLPEDATLADAAYELELRTAILEGIASLDRGEGMPLEEVEKLLPKWISK
jgi:hypothetical protein